MGRRRENEKTANIQIFILFSKKLKPEPIKIKACIVIDINKFFFNEWTEIKFQQVNPKRYPTIAIASVLPILLGPYAVVIHAGKRISIEAYEYEMVIVKIKTK